MATVDTEESKDLADRFQVNEVPTLIFFNKGKMYEYDGALDLDSLKAFALGGYKDESGE